MEKLNNSKMSDKRILILGAGKDQVPLIIKAKSRGLYVIVISPGGAYPGLKLADEVVYANVRDADRVLEIAKEKHIDAILSDQLDIAVPTVASVAVELGLPGVGVDVAETFTNKYKMRECCQRLGIPCPAFHSFDNASEATEFIREIGLPAVIKPIDFSGSRGVQIIDREEGFEHRFERSLELSKSGKVIVEEFVAGDEYVSQGFVEGGNPHIFAFAERFKFYLADTSIFNRTIFSNEIPVEFREKMRDYHSVLIEDASPNFGCTTAEWIHSDKDGKIYLVETAIRGAGVRMTSDLIPLAYGIDPQEYLISYALGEDQNSTEEAELNDLAAGYMTFLLPEGKVVKAEGIEEVGKIPGVARSDISLPLNTMTAPVQDKSARYGPVLVHGENRQAVMDIMKQVEEVLDIQVQTSTGLQGPIYR